jgi:hypothetical protein
LLNKRLNIINTDSKVVSEKEFELLDSTPLALLCYVYLGSLSETLVDAIQTIPFAEHRWLQYLQDWYKNNLKLSFHKGWKLILARYSRTDVVPARMHWSGLGGAALALAPAASQRHPGATSTVYTFILEDEPRCHISQRLDTIAVLFATYARMNRQRDIIVTSS